mgnify:CR=1 FL=1
MRHTIGSAELSYYFDVISVVSRDNLSDREEHTVCTSLDNIVLPELNKFDVTYFLIMQSFYSMYHVTIMSVGWLPLSVR